MSKYIQINLTAAEAEVMRAVLNDSAMSFDYLSQGHHSAEQRAADRLGISAESCADFATDGWRILDRALESFHAKS